ncbi:hypothetical protein U9M48_004178 [Paspalum notatum var. saurae]|uniref:non-specific serine/threonine protein kinase n=1 Tax=Paspalum notatum var. saurae TaxID=547442 RepID=A0AAQ3SKL3_PASNO
MKIAAPGSSPSHIVLMDYDADTHDLLERLLLDQSAEPRALPLALLRAITNDFSDDRKIGEVTFAEVYKGRLRSGTVAVKMHKSLSMGMDDSNFSNEVASLMRVKHKNVVRCLGYCAETQGNMSDYNGKLVLVETFQRLLCFEYLPKGSLHAYITDASGGLDWTKRYKIIKGVCEGLNYLHQNRITLESWSDRLGTSAEDTRLEQVRVCAEIGLSCLDINPEKRPDTRGILERLVETESMEQFTEPDETESMDEFTGPDETTVELNLLERIVAGTEEPSHLDLTLLENITENFSERKKIGNGGCGDVYKGFLHKSCCSEEVIQKPDNQRQDVSSGEERVVIYQGRTIMMDIRERLLCFEYISNGSLENHITDELRGLEWHTRYEIILGICNGLLYLHKEKDIIHMDLKPANILLDDRMVPKITDFGLSRFDNNSQAATTSRLVSPGYCAPEYLLEGVSSSKADIYSLGIIITELVTGSKNKPDLTKVLRRWRHVCIKSSEHPSLGYQQVTKCLVLAQKCMQIEPSSRPDISDVTNELNAIETKDGQFQDILGIEPLEIHVPFELDHEIAHSIELTNDTDDHIAFMTKCSVTITAQAKINSPPNDLYKKITVLSSRVDGSLAAMDVTGDMFIDKEGKVVDEVNVMLVFARPPLAEDS